MFSSVVHTWGVRLKGPVYVAIFRPFSIAIAAVAGVIFLGDDLYVGRYIYITDFCSLFVKIEMFE